MSLGKILVASGVLQEKDVNKALARQKQEGGLFGANLIALGLITPEQLETALHGFPTAPKGTEDTGVSINILLRLMLKVIYVGAYETPAEIADEMMLPYPIVATLLEEADDRRLVEILGALDKSVHSQFRYALTAKGREWAIEALEQSQYAGPAPVSLDSYIEQIERQKITNERINKEKINSGFEGLVVPESFLDELGPAINSGRALLLYGSPGNGKSSIAEGVGKVFEDVIYIPYCLELEGQIIKIFDPTIHRRVSTENGLKSSALFAQENQELDQRWVPCRRPVVITGGELNLEMLDLKYDPHSKFYVAPLHVKAIGGIFIIDDFGRQIVSPKDLLNRWIIPLEKRIDYLALRTGKTFSIPFDELVIFSTNMRPEDLMDPAFLRRIPYKLEIGSPTLDDYRTIFERVCEAQALELTEEMIEFVLEELHAHLEVPVARYQPKFIVDQVVLSCRYEGIPPALSRERIDAAWQNLYVRHTDPNVTYVTQAGGDNSMGPRLLGSEAHASAGGEVGAALVQLLESVVHGERDPNKKSNGSSDEHRGEAEDTHTAHDGPPDPRTA
ncbi:MAG: hypothetical protein V3V17_06100 [Alphaproteobacteria bacterium]